MRTSTEHAHPQFSVTPPELSYPLCPLIPTHACHVHHQYSVTSTALGSISDHAESAVSESKMCGDARLRPYQSSARGRGLVCASVDRSLALRQGSRGYRHQ